jgi:arsenate reductase
MRPPLGDYINRALTHIGEIPMTRARLLNDIAQFIVSKHAQGKIARLVFICTHNSRRSQMAQLWAAAAAAYHRIGDVQTYSGGTEVTAFNPRAVAAVERAGFAVENPGGDNPHYRLAYADGGPVITCFSKQFDDSPNPAAHFAAVMTCSDADAACPFVPGAETRVRLTYEDPKVADGLPEQDMVYDQRCMQIATEMLYLFSHVD